MSHFSSWSYTAKCTIWEPTLDAYDQPESYTIRTFDCDFKASGELTRDDKGSQFVAQTKIYLESSDEDKPKVGSYVVLREDASAAPPSDAEQIRRVGTYNANTFNEGLPDRLLVTG